MLVTGVSMAFASQTAAQEVANPLRFNSRTLPADRTIKIDEEAAGVRNKNAAIVMAASRVGLPLDRSATERDGERSIVALEASVENGFLYDMPVTLLGLRQTPRYGSNGQDNARELTLRLVDQAAKAPRGTIALNVAFSQNPIVKPFTQDELGSLLAGHTLISPDMNPRRAIPMGTGMASVVAFIAVTDQPALMTNQQTPAAFLQAARAAKPGVDVVQEARATMRSCIKQDNPALDLQACVGAGGRVAAYNLAKTGKTFQEVDGLDLIPVPDWPERLRNEFKARLNEE